MESKTAQNVQDTYFNTVRKDKTPLTIYLVNGVRVHGRIRSFDKFSVLLESGDQDQLVFKHAISTVTTGAQGIRTERRLPVSGIHAGPTSMGVVAGASRTPAVEENDSSSQSPSRSTVR